MDGAACRLRLSLVMAPYGDAMACPWASSDELAAYVSRRADAAVLAVGHRYCEATTFHRVVPADPPTSKL